MDEAAHADALGGLHHALGAAHVHLVEAATAGLARDGGKVNDRVRSPECFIELIFGDVGGARLDRIGPVGQTTATARDGNYAMTGCHQVRDQVAPDEAGRANHGNLHAQSMDR